MAQENKTNTQTFRKSVSSGGLLFISGQIGKDIKTGKLVDGTFELETAQAFHNLKDILAESNLTVDNLINISIYLTDMDNYDRLNKVYVKYFNGSLPARTCVAVSALPSGAKIEISGIAKLSLSNTLTNKEIIQHFMDEVRSGKNPDNAHLYMADTVLAHQMNAEDESTLKRTPENYTEHIRDFLKMYGDYSFETTALIAEGNKVYARWKQVGKHLTEIDGYPATGEILTEIGSAVYQLDNGKITEYWVQIDRLGFEKQLESK